MQCLQTIVSRVVLFLPSPNDYIKHIMLKADHGNPNLIGGLPSYGSLLALLRQPAGPQSLKPGGGQASAYQN